MTKEDSKNKRIKAWTVSCSLVCIVMRAFENKRDALDWLKEIRKSAIESSLKCRHRVVPCTITFNPKKK